MKNVRIRVRQSCGGGLWDYGIFEGRKSLFLISTYYGYEGVAIRCAKAMAKRIGIKYDPEIVKQKGC